MTPAGFSLWVAGHPPYRRQPDFSIRERAGARRALPDGAVWRDRIFVHVNPNPKTTESMGRWRQAWLDTDHRPFVSGPVTAIIEERILRPKGHLLADGWTLSAAGRSKPFPDVAPDVDNVEKAAFDALKNLAFEDDARVVNLLHTKRYVVSPRLAGILLTVRPADWDAPELRLLIE